MMTNKTSHALWLGVAATFCVAASAIGCANGEGGEPVATTGSPVSASDSTTVDDAIEKAVRDIETGRNREQARGELEGVLADPASTSDQRDDARLALSRYHELAGDQEAAIRVVEEALASHPLSERFAAKGLAEKRLRSLLTGKQDDGPRLPEITTVAPIAKALSKYFAVGAEGRTNVELLIFGRSPEDDAPKGTFNISGALQDQRREDCPLCTDPLSTSTSRSVVSSWVSIPAALAADSSKEPTLATALTVFYYDLETNRIPSRYDAYLPLPSARIAAHLEKGDGLVAVKIRQGAPPVVVIAAPRWAMLSDVERAFSELTEVPTEPKVISLSPDARPKEIQAVVRSAYPELRTCYETHLVTAPTAEGKIVMAFSINPEGTVADLAVSNDSTLTDATLRRCFTAAFAALKFPATGRTATVKYPISLSP